MLVTDLVCGQHKIVARYDGSYVFPLWKYAEQQGFDFHAERHENFDAELEATIKEKLGKNPDAEDLFAYIYAVLSSPSYRTRYAEFLKREFPRVPITSNAKLFGQLVEKGKQLIAVHLMPAGQLDDFITEFPVKGDNKVTKAAYVQKDERVWINAQQYFGGVPQQVWEFYVGGYQLLERWLKDRKGRVLSYDDVQHWQRIVVAITETMRIMQEIDGLVPGWPLL